MPIILVVDDSKIDRRIIGTMLEKDIDWLIDYAEDGAAALERMRIAIPDLVVTDLLMPGMDGVELVQAIRNEFSEIPVVLVAGQGSEELASRALRCGAASYVPKTHLAEGLLETVEQVLQLAASDQNMKRLMRCSTNVRHEFQLPSDPAIIPILIEYIQQTLENVQFCETVERRHVAVAIEEALLNAICHGNLQLEGDDLIGIRKELHTCGTSAIINQRCTEAPFKDRMIAFAFRVTAERAQFVIRDQGSGFDVSTVPSPVAPESVAGQAGRGLVLIQNFMDDVAFNESGNEIRMELRRPAMAAVS